MNRLPWILYDGDCLAEGGLSEIADASVDHVITDPPYEAEAHGKGRRTRRIARIEGKAVGVCVPEILPFDAITDEQRLTVGEHIGRIVKRWALVFCQTEGAYKWRIALERGGLDYVRTMIWVKPDAQPQFTGDRPGVGYESIVVAHRTGRKRWNGGGRVGVFTHGRERGPNGEGAPHPTTKPLPLMRELVELFTDEGETIVDPFAGSGSTGVACRMLGRHFIGWEIDREYAAIARRRLAGDEAKPSALQPSLW